MGLWLSACGGSRATHDPFVVDVVTDSAAPDGAATAGLDVAASDGGDAAAAAQPDSDAAAADGAAVGDGGKELPCSADNSQPEVCNKLDDNCNGKTDEDKVCCTCGDALCDTIQCGETTANCGVDCAPCGDGICSPGETPKSCDVDCCGTCGDAKCLLTCGENATTCPFDCATACGNDTCEGGENPQNCPEDCAKIICGNGTCDATETPATCPADCGTACGNCVCQNGENSLNCPADCGYCGDGVCSNCATLNESMSTCFADCGFDCAGPMAEAFCSDGLSCTFDSCNQVGGCMHIATPGVCDDGNACTWGDLCANDACLPGTATVCEDGNACSLDACDPLQGCVGIAIAATCTDGDACTLGDACSGGYCAGTPISCADGMACTADVCQQGACVHLPDSATCDACLSAWDACDDANLCTSDACATATGHCVHTPIADGTMCGTNGEVRICQAGMCACPTGWFAQSDACAPPLVDLVVPGATLSPAFTPEVTSYVAVLAPAAPSLALQALVPDGVLLTATLDGAPWLSSTPGWFVLAVAPTKVSVALTASSGKASRTYTIMLVQPVLSEPVLIPGTAAESGFGARIALDGDTLAVSGGPAMTGVRVFVAKAGTWTLQASLVDSADAPPLSAISLSGDTLAVGSSQGAGNVLLFERKAGAWQAPAIISEGMWTDFGGTVALHGDTVFISAWSGVAFAMPGAVCVYKRQASGAWLMQATLGAGVSSAGSKFGRALALSGTTAVVGAAGQGNGVCHMYDPVGSKWKLVDTLSAFPAQAGGAFGAALALDGGALLVGAPGVLGSTPGTAHAFTADPTGWMADTLPVHVPSKVDGYGSAVALSGDYAVIGAPGSAKVYVLHRMAGVWLPWATLQAPQGSAASTFGASVALSGTTLAVGDPGQGNVRVYQLTLP